MPCDAEGFSAKASLRHGLDFQVFRRPVKTKEAILEELGGNSLKRKV